MANFCENCGSPLKNENKFCPNCGAPVKQTEPTVPVTPVTPNPLPEDATIKSSPANAPVVDPSITSAVPDTSSAVTGAAGAAAAATLGAIHPDPVPEKPQDAFVPPREQTPPDPQPFHEEAPKDNGPSHSSLRQEAEQAFPHTDYIHKEEFARPGRNGSQIRTGQRPPIHVPALRQPPEPQALLLPRSRTWSSRFNHYKFNHHDRRFNE